MCNCRTFSSSNSAEDAEVHGLAIGKQRSVAKCCVHQHWITGPLTQPNVRQDGSGSREQKEHQQSAAQHHSLRLDVQPVYGQRHLYIQSYITSSSHDATISMNFIADMHGCTILQAVVLYFLYFLIFVFVLFYVSTFI